MKAAVQPAVDSGWNSSCGGLWQHMYLSQPACGLHVHVSGYSSVDKRRVPGEKPLSDYEGSFEIEAGTFGEVLERIGALWIMVPEQEVGQFD